MTLLSCACIFRTCRCSQLVVRAAGGVSNRDKEKQYAYKQVYRNYRVVAKI